ncbi:unnamed protein product [Rotaria socialis]
MTTDLNQLSTDRKTIASATNASPEEQNSVNVLNTSNSQSAINNNNKIDEYNTISAAVSLTTTKVESSTSENNQSGMDTAFSMTNVPPPNNLESEAMDDNNVVSKENPNTGEDNSQPEVEGPMDTSPPLSDVARKMSETVNVNNTDDATSADEVVMDFSNSEACSNGDSKKEKDEIDNHAPFLDLAQNYPTASNGLSDHSDVTASIDSRYLASGEGSHSDVPHNSGMKGVAEETTPAVTISDVSTPTFPLLSQSNLVTNAEESSTGSITKNEIQCEVITHPSTIAISLIDGPPHDVTLKAIDWFNLQFHDKERTIVKKPDQLENEMDEPNGSISDEILNRIQGSMIGMALGDALGAHVEFRPHQFLVDTPVTDLESGGTWGLNKGQFTDDTSMALCLANSLVACRDFKPYDQLVRYKWWHQFGYMSSTGHCFDIGAATSQSLREFERRQKRYANEFKISFTDMDNLSDRTLLEKFDIYCSEDGVAGNGALMRLAPVPLFFYRYPPIAVENSGISGQITHGDRKAYDACRYYGALIVAALHGYAKEQLLDDEFYSKHTEWFRNNPLHPDIESIAKGSYKKDGYNAGIRGKGYIVAALEAALWAFWSDDNSFEKGALAAVNLGDDTDTTAAIYGQLAGAHYGYRKLPERWLQHAYAKTFMEKLSKWIAYEGESWQERVEPTVSQLSMSNI